MTHKGSWQRPLQVTREERDLRYDLLTCIDPKQRRKMNKRIKELEKERQE